VRKYFVEEYHQIETIQAIEDKHNSDHKMINQPSQIRGVQLTLMSAHMSVSERFSLTLIVSDDSAHAHAHGERERYRSRSYERS
jgi:hypothetical protein